MVAIATILAKTKNWRLKAAKTGGSKMKKLLLAGALVVGLSFPLTSQAEVSAFGVQIPAKTPQLSDNINGGYVAQSLSDTFVVQKLQNSSESSSEESANENTYYVFGVELGSDNAI
jgi:hypothetical protein